MSTTGRSEQMNAFFNGYLTSSTTLQQFVAQYDNALLAKEEKKAHAKFESRTRMLECASSSPIEKHFQSVYTLAKFRDVQKEFVGRMNCFVSRLEEEAGWWNYNVGEEIVVGTINKVVLYIVRFKRDPVEVTCQCRMLEFWGILCRHSLYVLANEQVRSLLEQYTLHRWRKYIKCSHSSMKIMLDEVPCNWERMRFDWIRKSFNEVAEMGMVSADACNCVLDLIDNAKLKMSRMLRNQVTKSVLLTISTTDREHSSTKFFNPRAVIQKGRPRVNHRLSAIEEHHKKIKVARVRGDGAHREQGEITMRGSDDIDVPMNINHNGESWAHLGIANSIVP